MIKSIGLALSAAVGVHCFGSQTSGFTRRSTVHFATSTRPMTGKNNMLMYDSGPQEYNMWTVLSKTEKWLSNVVGGADSPYKRKEVAYFCEPANEDTLVVASLWKRLREARERGQVHGQNEEEKCVKMGPSHTPKTFRETQVVIIPNEKKLSSSFKHFNKIVEGINRCRRESRGFALVTDEENAESDLPERRDWSVAINCAHLHPKFGEKSKEEIMKDMLEEEKNGEVDVNLQMYKKKRNLARRSPYPMVCIEVRSTPPPDLSSLEDTTKEPNGFRDSPQPRLASLEDIQRLEAMFAKTDLGADGQFTPQENVQDRNEESFFDALSNVAGIQEISLDTPMNKVQNWIANYDDAFEANRDTLTMTEATQVDGAFEHVFGCIAMNADRMKREKFDDGPRQYVVFPSFLTSAVEAFQQFAHQVNQMIKIVPSIKGRISVHAFHPMHIDPHRRTPVPVLVLQWNANE